MKVSMPLVYAQTLFARSAFFCLIALMLSHVASAQTVTSLYEAEDYDALIRLQDKSDSLTAKELYFVGQALYYKDQDKAAIKCYDLAIKKGLDDDLVYLKKGLAQQYIDDLKGAQKSLRQAYVRNRNNQETITSIGNIFLFEEKLDSALAYFQQATLLPYEYAEPYFKLGYTYQLLEKFDQAIEAYTKAQKSIDQEHPRMLDVLSNKAVIQVYGTKDYPGGITSLETLIQLAPDQYDYYSLLIQAYNSNEEPELGDSLFRVIQIEYEAGKLPEDLTKYETILIDEFYWEGRLMRTFRYFDDPTEMLDITFKTYMINEEKDSVEHLFTSEKTIQLGKKGPKHLLCAWAGEKHLNYGFGWAEDLIAHKAYKAAMLSVLEEKRNPAAMSVSGTKESEKKRKKRKKKKRK